MCLPSPIPSVRRLHDLTVQHLTQQNVGILLLYHNSGEAVVPRPLESRTLQIPAIMFTGLYLAHTFLQRALLIQLAEICIALCLLLCCNYLWHLYQEAQKGGRVNLSAVCFWLLSTWVFLPLAFCNVDFFTGMMIPVFVHWCHYLGLNYILVARKYAAENSSSTSTKRPIVLFFVICFAIAAIVTVAADFSYFFRTTVSLTKSILNGFVLGFAFVHYFQDAFIWRFRDPFQRQSILPYLKQPKNRGTIHRRLLG